MSSNNERHSQPPVNKVEAPQIDEQREREQIKQEISSLAKALAEQREDLPFEGITNEGLATLKAEEADEYYPDFITKIDVLVERCHAHGIKVALGDDPNSGNVFILPVDGNDVEVDGMRPKHLKVTDQTDSKLKRLIELSQRYAVLAAKK